MNSKGSIEPNFDALDELFRAVINEFSNKQTYLAIWTVETFDLSQFDSQLIGAESPFPSKSSRLAGDGLLLPLQSLKGTELLDVLCDRLTYEILHIEIEVEGEVQFSAYDHFVHVMFGNGISIALLQDLQTRGVISSYEVYDDQEMMIVLHETPFFPIFRV
jgi:hypothetical protein